MITLHPAPTVGPVPLGGVTKMLAVVIDGGGGGVGANQCSGSGGVGGDASSGGPGIVMLYW